MAVKKMNKKMSRLRFLRGTCVIQLTYHILQHWAKREQGLIQFIQRQGECLAGKWRLERMTILYIVLYNYAWYVIHFCLMCYLFSGRAFCEYSGLRLLFTSIDSLDSNRRALWVSLQSRNVELSYLFSRFLSELLVICLLHWHKSHLILQTEY